MCWRHLLRSTLVLTLAVGLAACGDDDPTDPGDDLTEAEAALLVEAIAESGGFGLTAFGGGPAAVTIPIQQLVQPCPEGGNVVVDGSIEVNDQTQAFGMTLTQVHQNCVVTPPSGGGAWTLNGNPNITVSFTGSANQNNFDFGGTQTGAVAWSRGGKSGSCQVALNYNFTGNTQGTSFSGTITGTVCGFTVSETLTISN